MKPDQYRKKHQAPRGDDRTRRQIANEAARRLLAGSGGSAESADDPYARVRDASESDLYAAKRRAAAVLGHAVRPGDLPTDAEVRAQALALVRDAASRPGPDTDDETDRADDPPEPAPDEAPRRLADTLDRFAVYALRLAPLEAVKQLGKHHPEGDALYHSLQVFELARQARPYDEEFLLAALLHDVGKAIEPSDHVAAGVEALRGAVPERTLLLVEHHMDLLYARPGDPPPVRDPDLLDDLELLRECDNNGRVPGAEVGTVADALAYLQRLEREEYLDEG